MTKILGCLELLETQSLELSRLNDVDGITEDDILSRIIPIKSHRIIKLGRNNKEAHLVIDHPVVSAIHCIIWCVLFDEESFPMCYIKDVSLNGTKINGEVLLKDASYLLKDKDIISIECDSGIICSLKFVDTIARKPNTDLLKQLNVERYVDGWEISTRVVGNGTFGHVLVCGNKNIDNKSQKNDDTLQKNYAVKIIKLKPNKLNKEAKILLQLNHPNIIKVYYTHMDLNNNLFIFQDLISGGDLFSYLAKTDCLTAIPETESLLIVYQILLALRYLHKRGVVHRDLKLDNILLASPEPCTKITLADFGIAKHLTSTKTRMHTVVGTPEYCAPEVGFKANREMYQTFSRAATLSDRDIGYSNKCDLWSLGVITHIMLTGISPFYGDGTEKSIIESAMRGNINYNIRHWEKISSTAKEFVKNLLQVDVRERFDSNQAINHPWIKVHRNQLDQIYQKKILQQGTTSTPITSLSNSGNLAKAILVQDTGNLIEKSKMNWKRKLPKTIVVSNKKMKLNTLHKYTSKQKI
ncbi:similar to Saccharomyces cerevisiae YOR351C MEK1 Meiosis-specific serine/threonine protein kinase [Maudiozyma barnettii]|uniref:Similar to Saccharomyces cerevisiae YOR351C MEK1 Meiosis-specific serine/threonine protein kinase n=1 Tax=Maudiozyma barnettii TaxID=61262 RepID=A0A8H2VFW5_9SACH|nr:serine/threonine protein kinase MEK1 [Kazachstania barnettii]CAB4254846.1 similar to Saccharomyces cerevisiae YOR351C MEK1 Meiosis-specific serine/threonine protein kinase [Kazachstania barnettii]CAD1783053.1 similar to Saccharomyces cerevisiae YOR351C MEK1 Meiosis-specific serine/threonine protein kinase [Kazachstania barnettii]